jgi:hypothetical protein
MSKKVRRLSDEEQLQLRNSAKEELIRLKCVFDEKETKQLIDNFKDEFTICEMVYKVILRHHQKNKGNSVDRLQIRMTQVPYALKYAGYDFDKELLDKIFGSEDKVGSRTVKKIRDALTHSVDQKAIDELFERKDELFGYMNSFIEKINYFDLDV